MRRRSDNCIGIGANTSTFGAIDTLLLRTPAHVV